MIRRRTPRLQFARGIAVTVLLAVVLVQFLGQVHRVLHAHGADAAAPKAFAEPLWGPAFAAPHGGHPASHRPDLAHPHRHDALSALHPDDCEAGHADSIWDRLFADHERLADCEAYDHLTQPGGLASTFLPDATAPSRECFDIDWQSGHWAAQARGYLARGPPTRS